MTKPTWARLSKLLLDAAAVVFAVLVALAVDEWWEERENVQRAEMTVEAIAREIRENRRDVASFGGAGDPDSMLAGVEAALTSQRAGQRPEGVNVNWDVTLLSSAAWEAARLTSSPQYIGLDRVVDLAEVYEFQRYYLDTQADLLRRMSGIEARMETEPVATLIDLRSAFGTALGLRRALGAIYACTLVELEGPDAVEPGACPQGEMQYGPGAVADSSG
jgi:hypothetical protein